MLCYMSLYWISDCFTLLISDLLLENKHPNNKDEYSYTHVTWPAFLNATKALLNGSDHSHYVNTYISVIHLRFTFTASVLLLTLFTFFTHCARMLLDADECNTRLEKFNRSTESCNDFFFFFLFLFLPSPVTEPSIQNKKSEKGKLEVFCCRLWIWSMMLWCESRQLLRVELLNRTTCLPPINISEVRFSTLVFASCQIQSPSAEAAVEDDRDTHRHCHSP